LIIINETYAIQISSGCVWFLSSKIFRKIFDFQFLEFVFPENSSLFTNIWGY
jgi:hypothetical protein